MKISEEMYKMLLEQQTSNSNISLIVSALILAVSYAHLSIEKISVAGADLSIKDPFVISGALGIVLIYSILISIRFLATVNSFGAIIDPEHFERMKTLSSFRRAFMFFTSLAILIVQAGSAILALIVAWPNVIRLVGVAW